VSADGAGYEGENMLGLLAASFHDGEEGFDESAAGGAWGAEGELPPDDSVPQRALAGVVRRLDAFHLCEGPQPIAMVPEFFGHADAGELPAQQQGVDSLPDHRCASVPGVMRR
jgi:hypothetical protein